MTKVPQWHLSLADADRWTHEQENHYDAIELRSEMPTLLRENYYSSHWYDTSQQAESKRLT